MKFRFHGNCALFSFASRVPIRKMTKGRKSDNKIMKASKAIHIEKRKCGPYAFLNAFYRCSCRLHKAMIAYL